MKSKNKLREILSFAPGVDLCVIEPNKMLPEADDGHGRLARACIRYRSEESEIPARRADGSMPETVCWPVYFGELQCPFEPDELDEYVERCEKKKEEK